MSNHNSMMNERQRNFTNLYIKNFGQNMNESKLCQLFSVYGTITSCKIQTDNNGQSKGFGFVNFERPEMAKNAMENLNGYLLEDGKNLYVGRFQKKSERQNQFRRIQEENLTKQSNNLCLYISNLDTTVDEKILQAIFNRFGKITNIHILRNGYQSKGIGFISFETIEETTKALNEMNGKWILSKPIYVKLSKDHDNSQLPTTSTTPSYPPINPMPYFNTPMMFYLPSMIIPPPTPNNFPMPIASSSAQMPMMREYPLPPPPPNNFPMPMMSEYPPVRRSNTPTKQQVYPYIRVKSDDQ